jgi:DNA-binding transcriptional LysR family regulator
VEHSTVSRRVDTLEQALALRLFDRLPRGWQLTAEGEYLLPLAQGMEEESLALQRAAVGAGASRGVVRISAPPSFASLFLVPHIAAMRELWPEVELQIIGELREANLSRREADLALRMGRPQEATLAARPLARIGLGLYARRGYTQRDEALWEFVAAEERLTHLPHHHWLKEFAGPRRVALRSNDQIAVHGAVRAGLGLGLVPHFEARSDPEAGGSAQRDHATAARTVARVAHRRAPLSARARHRRPRHAHLRGSRPAPGRLSRRLARAGPLRARRTKSDPPAGCEYGPALQRITTPQGSSPTGMSCSLVSVAVSMTDTELERPLAT